MNRTGLVDGVGGGDASQPTLDGRGDAADHATDLGAAGGQTGRGGGAGTTGAGGDGGGAGMGSGGGAGGAGGANWADGASDTSNVGDGASDTAGDGRTDGAGVDAAIDALSCGASPLCDNTNPVVLPGGRFTGNTSGASLDHGSCGGDKAPEAVFKVVLAEKSDVFITTHGSSFDTVIYMRSDCCGAEIGCNDEADNRHTSMLMARGLAAGKYEIFVDGAKAADHGAFTIDIYATPTSPNTADNCGSATRIANLPITSTTCGLDDDFSPLVGCLVMPQTTAADAVYYFVLDAQSTMVKFSTCTKTCIDTILSVRDICTTPTTQSACNDNWCSSTPPPPATSCPAPGLPTQSQVTATLGAGVHYLILDSHVAAPTAAACGPFTITPTGVPQ